MDVLKMVDELRTERAQIEEAIMVLERIAPRSRQTAWPAAGK